jgi:hypothetical protein
LLFVSGDVADTVGALKEISRTVDAANVVAMCERIKRRRDFGVRP